MILSWTGQGCGQQFLTLLAARPATMKTQCQSTSCSALWLSAEEATLCSQLGFQVEDDSQDQRGAWQILQIYDAADCAGSLDLTCNCISILWVYFFLKNMIEVSAYAWHAILYLITVTPWQYLPRLGMLFYILSSLGSICLGLASAEAWLQPWHAIVYQGLVCYSISYHALAVSAEAWHAILYLIMP